MFHSIGPEILQAPSAHTLKTKPHPCEVELFLFQSCFDQQPTHTEIEVIWRAMKKAFHNESRRLWHTGDRVKILEGAFMGMLSLYTR